MGTQRRLARLARLHAKWTARHKDDFPVSPEDFGDGSRHNLDLHAPPAVEAEFQRAAEKIFPREASRLETPEPDRNLQPDPGSAIQRSWTTLWDRPNRRVLILAGRGREDRHWKFVERDSRDSIEGVYDVWRASDGNRVKPVRGADPGEIVLVEVRLGEDDSPLGFPDHLLDPKLLGSMTIWPNPEGASFVWWFETE